MPLLTSATVAYYSRVLIYRAGVGTAPSNLANHKSLFSSASAFLDIQGVTSIGEIASVTPNLQAYPVFGQSHSTYREGQATLNPLEITATFNATTLNDLPTTPTVLAVQLLGSKYSGVLTDAAQTTSLYRANYFNWGILKVLGVTAGTTEVLSYRLQWTPQAPWYGPSL